MKGKQTLQKICHGSKLYLKRNSSTILTCVGAVGVVLTAVTAAKATPKAIKILEKAREEKGEDLTKLETIVSVSPAYIPAVAIGASTIACIFGANVLNKRHQAALTSAYALVDSSYKKYRTKLKELYGEEADIQIREAIINEECKDIDVWAPGCGSIDRKGERRIFEFNGRVFESTMESVINAEYHFNRNFSLRGDACLNEFYEFLGLSTTEEGSILGWSCGQLIEDYETTWIDFDHRPITLEGGIECFIIETLIEPIIDYENR